MTYKIMELAMDAGLLNYIDGETPRFYFITGHASGHEVNEFAKLILQECITICENGSATQMTSAGAAQMIKLHFGIK